MDYLELKDMTVEEIKRVSALELRTIYLYTNVTTDECFKLNFYLNRIRKQDFDDGIAPKDAEPITIIISSFGGSLYDILASISLVEQMVEEGYEIISIVDGYAMSAGSALSMTCSKRYARRYSTLLIHQLSSFNGGTLAEMQVQMEENHRLWQLMKKIMLKHTDMTEEYIDSIYTSNKDVYLSPEESLSLGIIDEIL